MLSSNHDYNLLRRYQCIATGYALLTAGTVGSVVFFLLLTETEVTEDEFELYMFIGAISAVSLLAGSIMANPDSAIASRIAQCCHTFFRTPSEETSNQRVVVSVNSINRDLELGTQRQQRPTTSSHLPFAQ